MDDRWQKLIRVRDLRTRVALSEVTGRRLIQARARTTLEHARNVQAQYEQEAADTSALLTSRSIEGGEISAAHAQELLRYATGLRLKANEATAPIRRAQLQYDRARVAADEASEGYRREAGRRETIYSQWRVAERADRRLKEEREDQSGAEDRAGVAACRIARDNSG
jgi:hypothetical protein